MIVFIYESPRSGNISVFGATYSEPNIRLFKSPQKMFEYIDCKLKEGKRFRRTLGKGWGDDGYTLEICKKDFKTFGEPTRKDLEKKKKEKKYKIVQPFLGFLV